MLLEQVDTAVVRRADQAMDLAVDLGCLGIGVALVGCKVAAEEDLAAGRIVVDRTDLIAEAVVDDHGGRHCGRLLDIAVCTGGDIAHDQHLGDAAAQIDDQVLLHIAAGAVCLILGRQGHGEAACAVGARDDGDMVHRILRGQHVEANRVTGLVVGGQALILRVDDMGALLHAHDHLEHRILDLLARDQLLVAACRQQSCLIEQVFEIGAGEAGGGACDLHKVDIGIKLLAARVHLEDGLTADDIGCADIDLTVEAAGTEQCVIQNVLTVGCRDDDDALVDAEAVHLDEQLVQGLLALVVTAAQTCAALTADRVDLIDEHDRRRVLLGLIEQVAHTGCADADIQLNEVRTGNRQEGHAGLTCDRLGEQGLTGAGRAYEQNALGNARADRLELGRILQEIDHLLQLCLLLIRAGNILEGDLVLALACKTGARLAELHRIAAAALLVHHEVPDGHHENDQDEIRNERHPPRDLCLAEVVVLNDALVLLLLDQIERLLQEHGNVGHFKLYHGLVLQRQIEHAVLIEDILDLLLLDELNRIRIHEILGGLIQREHITDGCQHTYQNDKVYDKTFHFAFFQCGLNPPW